MPRYLHRGDPQIRHSLHAFVFQTYPRHLSWQCLALDGMGMCPRVPEDPALLHTHLPPWLLYILCPEHRLLLALVLTSAEAGGSAAGPYSGQVACAMPCGTDAVWLLFSGCPDARHLGCVLLQAAGTAETVFSPLLSNHYLKLTTVIYLNNISQK